MNFVFQKGNEQANVYIGRASPNITMAVIQEARVAAKMPDGAIFLNVCHLGKMSREEFVAETEKETA
jgi:hypothetical protein